MWAVLEWQYKNGVNCWRMYLRHWWVETFAYTTWCMILHSILKNEQEPWHRNWGQLKYLGLSWSSEMFMYWTLQQAVAMWHPWLMHTVFESKAVHTCSQAELICEWLVLLDTITATNAWGARCEEVAWVMCYSPIRDGQIFLHSVFSGGRIHCYLHCTVFRSAERLASTESLSVCLVWLPRISKLRN